MCGGFVRNALSSVTGALGLGQQSAPTPPPAPEPTAPAPVQQNQQAQGQANEQRRRRALAAGRQSTILTGAGGATEMAGQGKSLLGM